mgnify:CR=1 FL=1
MGGFDFDKAAEEGIWGRPDGIYDSQIVFADGVFKTGSEEAKLAGLSGLDSTNAPAAKGPILDKKIRKNPEGYQRKACWNPVIYQIPGGDLVIYFKIGNKVADWTGWMVRSKDGGKTWSKREPLQEAISVR